MPLADLYLYQRDTARRGFPAHRIEMLLAQVSMVLCMVHGAKDLSLNDFMLKPASDEAPQEVGDDDEIEPDANQEAAREFFGFNPRNANRVRDNTYGQ